MKNIFKKNQIIIMALAIMIIIAGYLNYSGKNDKDKANIADVGSNEELGYDTYSEETTGDQILDDTEVKEGKDTAEVTEGELVLEELTAETDGEVKSEEVATTENPDVVVETVEVTDISDEDSKAEEVAQLDVKDNGEVTVDENDADVPGEAILVSTTIAPDFFANAKLQREQSRAIRKETLMEVVDNLNISDSLKADAIAGIIALANINEKENATETLLEANGFSDCVVSITEESVDVIINATSVTEQDIAQVEDIVKRKTGAETSEITIKPVIITE